MKLEGSPPAVGRQRERGIRRAPLDGARQDPRAKILRPAEPTRAVRLSPHASVYDSRSLRRRGVCLRGQESPPRLTTVRLLQCTRLQHDRPNHIIALPVYSARLWNGSTLGERRWRGSFKRKPKKRQRKFVPPRPLPRPDPWTLDPATLFWQIGPKKIEPDRTFLLNAARLGRSPGEKRTASYCAKTPPPGFDLHRGGRP